MIKLPGIFKNHAVLQRDQKISIWGKTDAKQVYITIKDANGDELCKLDATSNNNIFEVKTGPFNAGGPYNLIVCAGDDKCVLDDIYFGDVYIAGGQSNMELELQNSKDGKEECENCDNPNIRFYYTPKVAWLGEELNKAESESAWQLCKPGETKCWSAVGYYFAKALTEEIDKAPAKGLSNDQNIMIGIIGCNWGGTSASAWMSKEKLSEYPETKVYLDRYDELTKDQDYDEYLKAYDEYVVYQAEFDKNVGNYYMTAKNPSWDEAIKLFGENKYPGPMGPKNWTRPSGLYETMLKRIAPYGICGVLWYQGEDDDNRPYAYKRLLKSLIENWREDFENSELPFYIVQLPVFKNEGEDDFKNWPFLRESEFDISTEDDNCHTAVCLEAGEKYNIHPLDKETVGYRLAYLALYNRYGLCDKWDAYGPSLINAYSEGNFIYAEIDCCDNGLVTDGDDGFLEDVYMESYLPDDAGFEIAGKDGVYFDAKVQVLRGDDCIVLKMSSDKVSEPLFARYFWKNFGKVRVYGACGIPLAPFRTDKNDNAKALGTRQGELLG
ncbi:MAG: sialate O-acetylesterase [Lachnospiraceae bacterium]|nr:sialate O-acetylesterase [Lachnospiraceae bacterium]